MTTPKLIKCSPGQKRMMNTCVLKRPEAMKEFCMKHEKDYDRVRQLCVKPASARDRKAQLAEIIRTSYNASRNEVINNTLRVLPDKFLMDIVKKYKHSTIGKGPNEVRFIRLSPQGAVYDIILGGANFTPLGMYKPLEIPHNEVVPSGERLGVWLGTFTKEGFPIFVNAGKIWWYDGEKHALYTTPEILQDALKIQNTHTRTMYDRLKPKAPKTTPKPKTLVETKLAVAKALQAKHGRDKKAKYDRLVATRTAGTHAMMKKALPTGPR